jgi:hypothetical protein
MFKDRPRVPIQADWSDSLGAVYGGIILTLCVVMITWLSPSLRLERREIPGHSVKKQDSYLEEIRKHSLPRPAWIASQGCITIKVVRRAASINHAIWCP